MDGCPPSKKKKVCKEGGSSEEASQSTTSPKKSQEKLSLRHSGSLSQEQTSSAGTNEETEEFRICPRCRQAFIRRVLHLHVLMNLCTSLKMGISQSPISISPAEVIKTLIAFLKNYYLETEIGQTPSAGTSRTNEETAELHTCSKCGKSFRSNMSLVYHLLTIHKSGSPSQEQTPSAGTSQSPISPAGDFFEIAELIILLKTYLQEIEQTSSAGTSRTSEETEELHMCPKCEKRAISNLFLVYHLLHIHRYT